MLDPAQPEISSVVTPSANSHGRLWASALLLGVAMIGAKLLAFAKEWLVAKQLGVSDAVDAYWMALLLPSFAVGVASQSLTAAFQPSYARTVHQQGPVAARLLLAGMLSRALAVLVLLTVIGALAAPVLLPWIATGFAATKLELTLALYYKMLGILLACGLTSLFAAVLNAHEQFAATALAPFAPPAVTVAVFALFGKEQGIDALAVGTLLGFIAEAALLGWMVWRRGLAAWPRWSASDAALSLAQHQSLHAAVGWSLVCAATVVDQSMAASLESGNVAILNYSYRIVSLVLNVVAVSLSTVLFPRFSRLQAVGNRAQLASTLRHYTWAILLGSIPLLGVLAWLGEPLVRLLFQRGAFTSETTQAVSQVQFYYLPQIPFYILTLLGGRLLSALDGNAALARIAALNLVTNIVGNLVFMHWFGVAGIAMSSSLVYVIAWVVTYAAIYNRLRN